MAINNPIDRPGVTHEIVIKDNKPVKERYVRAQDVHETCTRWRHADPNYNRFADILRAYYRLPYRVSADEKRECLARNPANANFGEMADAIDEIKGEYLEMVEERKPAFNIKTTYKPPVDPGSAPSATQESNAEQIRYNQVITTGFQKFFIDRWFNYINNFDVEFQDLLLTGKSYQAWLSPTGPESTVIPQERVYLPPDASLDCNEWDGCGIVVETTGHHLWEMAINNENWDEEQVGKWLKTIWISRNEGEREEEAIKKLHDGSDQSYYHQMTVRVIFFYIREYEESEGNKVSLYVIPEVDSPETKPGNEELGDTWSFFCEAPHSVREMSDVISPLIDHAGHGKMNGIPSKGLAFYTSSRIFDDLMNSSAEAGQINSMLLTTGVGDNADGEGLARHSLRNQIHFPPGTEPRQVQLQLPVQENAMLADSIARRTRYNRGAGQVRQSQFENAGDRRTAQQVSMEAAEASAIKTPDLKRINRFLHRRGEQWFMRFRDCTVADGESHTWKKAFMEYLEDNNVPADAIKGKYICVRSNLLIGTANRQMRFAQAEQAFAVLNRVPRSAGQLNAQKQALAALVGVDNVDAYFENETPDYIPGQQDRMVGMENNGFKTQGARPDSFIVLPTDDHFLHLFGEEKSNGKTTGHLEAGLTAVQEGLRMLEIQVPPADEASHMQVLSDIINEVAVGLEHSKAHALHLEDKASEAAFTQARQTIAQTERWLSQLSANYARKQQGRMADAQGGTLEDAEFSQKMREKELDLLAKRNEAQIKEQRERAVTAARVQSIHAQSEAKREAALAEAAIKGARQSTAEGL